MALSRRKFINTIGVMVPGTVLTGLSGAVFANSSKEYKINGVSLFLVNVTKERNFSYGTWHNRQHIFIAIESSEFTGWSEILVAKNQPDFNMKKWGEIFSPIKGLSVKEAIDFVREKYFDGTWNKGDSEAVQIALYDLLGKTLNKPTIEIWGLPNRKPVPGIFTILEKNIEKALAQAETAQIQNLKSHVKVKLFGDKNLDIKLIKAVNKKLGNETFILGDPNRGYKYIDDLNELASILKNLHKAGMDAVEDPSELTKKQWIELNKKVGDLALAPDKIMRPANIGLEVFSPEMGTYFNLHPNQMGSLDELNKLAFKITSNKRGLMIGDASLVGPACTFWQQIAIGHGASWVEALEKPHESDVFPQCVQKMSTKINNGKTEITHLYPGFGIEMDNEKLKKLADKYARIF